MAVSFKAFSWPAVAGRPGVVYSTEIVPVGTTAKATDNREYVFLAGVASTILGSWVTFDELGVTAGIDSGTAASIKGDVAVATAAVVANKYGWYGRKGHFACGAISGGDAAADGKVFATSTIFLADDVAVTGNQIHGAIFRTQEGEANAAFGLDATAALATVQIDHPFIGVTDAII
jgi:hypothetical protein